jgi:hypothetical protein
MKRLVVVWLGVLLSGSCASDMPVEDLCFPGEEKAMDSFSHFYTPVEYTCNPGMEGLSLPLNTDKVINLTQILALALQTAMPEPLVENGFAVFPMRYPVNNPVQAFERLSGADQPVFVSSGIPLHMLHIFFDQILQQVETDDLYPDLMVVCRELYINNLNRNNLLNAAFFAVSLNFLDEDFVPDNRVAEMVQEEVALMTLHGGFHTSPVFGYREDYSQYVPRGHYTSSEKLENYFKAMMYMGRLTYILKGGNPSEPDEHNLVSEETAREMTASAVVIVSDLNTIEVDGIPLREKWERIYQITAFFAGFADDLSVSQYHAAAQAVSGNDFSSELLEEESFYDDFQSYIAENYAGPSVYSGTGASVVMPDENGAFPEDGLLSLLEKTTGFRFFGQRYTPDSEILGRFVFPSIGLNPDGEQRFMPSGLDVAASFRCEAALDIVNENGSVLFSGYEQTLDDMQEIVDNYTVDDWHATLYMCWLHSLRLLAAPRGNGYPDFMQTDGWSRCSLSTFLASWAMLRHDTILYAKQSYTAMAGCAPDFEEPVPSAGFVEPVPEVYAELRATLQMARRALEYYNVYDESLTRRFSNAESLLGTLQSIAERELAGEMLSTEDADFLKGFARYLEGSIVLGEVTTEGLETSLVADVHTDQNSSSVLEVASGDLDNCVVVYRRADGVVEAAIGPVLSYYQFSHPMNDMLTDEAWREMLASDPPQRPQWTSSYICD